MVHRNPSCMLLESSWQSRDIYGAIQLYCLENIYIIARRVTYGRYIIIECHRRFSLLVQHIEIVKTIVRYSEDDIAPRSKYQTPKHQSRYDTLSLYPKN